MILCLAAACVLIASLGLAQPVSLIQHGDFERRPLDLTLSAGAAFDDQVAHSGKRSVRVMVEPRAGERTSGSGSWTVEGFRPGATYTVSAWVRAQDIVANEGVQGYGYVAMYQYDKFGDYVAYFDFTHPVGTLDWERHTHTFTIGEETTRLVIPFGLFQASGTLWVDDFTLVEGEQAADVGEIAQPPSAGAAGGKPGIAILKDDLPVVGVGSEPEYLKEILDAIPGQPYETTLISAAQLADRLFLTPERFSTVILPYGETFPAPAADAFRRFLRGGGNMLTMGGYAFNNLVGGEPPAAAKPTPEECSWFYRIPVEPDMPGKAMTFRGHLRCRGVTGGFAYLAVYQFDKDGKLGSWRDTLHLVGDQDWTANQYAFRVDQNAAVVEIKAGLFRCTGTASIDDISVTDDAGREYVTDGGFENVTAPDDRRPHNWFRTQKDLASIVGATPHSGSKCARVKLAAAGPSELIMNTARGAPLDGLQVAPEQIGVFDAQFPLKRVEFARAAPDQYIVPQNFVADAPMQGWSATTVLGYDDARRVPLVNCYDRYQRLRGSAASITYRYGGHYARSAWAIFGSTDFDFFPRDAPAATELLVPIVDALVTETFLHNLETNYATYRQGEPVQIKVQVSNWGPAPQAVSVDFQVTADGKGKPIQLHSPGATLQPDETREFTVEWSPGRFEADFYRVEATLSLDERPSDKMETGFCVWDEKVVKSGPDCVLEGNLFRLNGREHFLQGTDSFSFAFYSAHENPLVWKRDFETMRDSGMNLPENLQVSAVSQSPPYEWPESLLRKTDAMVQLAQQYGQVYMPGLLIGANVVVEDDVLEREAAWVQAFVKRYKDVPGILWYINGDFQLRLDDNLRLAEERGGEPPRTDVERLWNEFLKTRYATDETLAAAWKPERVTGPLGHVPLQEYGADSWDDVRGMDLARFKVELMTRWINRHVRAIREVDQHHAITSEYYQTPGPGIDIIQAIGDHTCANIGYFDKPERDIARFPSVMRHADLRERGKSMSAGEFGCKTHPAWGGGKDWGYHIARTDEQQEQLWLAITHYGWGLGASKIHNWDWKDNVEWIFPWGMVYPGDWVKKDCLDVYRAAGLTFRQFERRYEPPSVYVLTPDTHRLGQPVWTVFEATLSCFRTLQEMGVSCGTLNECSLEAIPPSAKVIFYPIPYQIPDDVCAKLLDWVKAGGTLYVSGDVSYDMLRTRTLTDRLKELCGVEFVAERYPNVACDEKTGLPAEIGGEQITVNPAIVVKPTGAQVLVAATDADKTPVLLSNALGKGRVLFCTWPLERDEGFAEGIAARNSLVYRTVLGDTGAARDALGAALPLSVPLAGTAARGEVWVNPTDAKVNARTADGAPPLELTPHRTGCMVWAKNSALLALEDGKGAHFMSYSLDGQDVRSSTQLCVLPLTEGTVRLDTRAEWSKPVALVGEVRGGEWVEYERIEAPVRGGSIRLEIDQDRCFSIILVAEESQVKACTTRLVRSLREPWHALPKG